MARVILKTQVSNAGPSWPSCLIILDTVYIYIPYSGTPLYCSVTLNIVSGVHWIIQINTTLNLCLIEMSGKYNMYLLHQHTYLIIY